MRNLEIVRLFNEIADLLEIKDENIFKIRAYRRAAMNLESLTEEIEGSPHARGDDPLGLDTAYSRDGL